MRPVRKHQDWRRPRRWIRQTTNLTDLVQLQRINRDSLHAGPRAVLHRCDVAAVMLCDSGQRVLVGPGESTLGAVDYLLRGRLG